MVVVPSGEEMPMSEKNHQEETLQGPDGGC